ncbi:ABC transporter substrate-binding protein [Halomarina rubra]|uniref:Thiamine pyrimidine synthase n=1 Tax=Halomarina rubra TaxID=2071873 RepID=A0ABD6AW92_9EURY|nr:ABC transporter substrate-binding protein [Halomarina rubra]
MHWREFPVLPADETLFEGFRAGLDTRAARILAYLVRRRTDPEIETAEATRLSIRIGTELGREPTIAALSTLCANGLVEETTVDRERPGRPPKGWVAVHDSETTMRLVQSHHSYGLLEQADEVAKHFEVALPDAWFETVDPEDVTPVDRTSLTVALNWMPNGLHAPIIAAVESGHYERAGLDITLEPARGSGAATEHLRTGQADVALIGAASVCSAAPESFVPLAQLRQRSLAVLYTTTERLGAPFTSVEQVRGHRLAVTPDSEVGRLARLFLAHTGILDSVDIVAVSGEERTALARGDADVATGMPFDAYEFSEAGYEVSSLAVADHFPVPGPALVTTADTLQAGPKTMHRFLMATIAGVVTVHQQPEETAVQVATQSGDAVENERWRIDHAQSRAAERGVGRDHGWGRQTVEGWERLQVALRQEESG